MDGSQVSEEGQSDDCNNNVEELEYEAKPSSQVAKWTASEEWSPWTLSALKSRQTLEEEQILLLQKQQKCLDENNRRAEEKHKAELKVLRAQKAIHTVKLENLRLRNEILHLELQEKKTK